MATLYSYIVNFIFALRLEFSLTLISKEIARSITKLRAFYIGIFNISARLSIFLHKLVLFGFEFWKRGLSNNLLVNGTLCKILFFDFISNI